MKSQKHEPNHQLEIILGICFKVGLYYMLMPKLQPDFWHLLGPKVINQWNWVYPIFRPKHIVDIQGLVNVPIEHHPTIGDVISNRYLKVMFKIPKKGHLPTPDIMPMKSNH